MISIEIETLIAAPIERVFDLSRSIDAHMATTKGTGEKAVAGRTSGLIGEGETVTWEARHFLVRQRLTTKITRFERPTMFEDQMVKGVFKSICHGHFFEPCEEGTLMRDHFEFSAPLGPLGWMAERLFLRAYMERFLRLRNVGLKNFAESDEWQRVIP